MAEGGALGFEPEPLRFTIGGPGLYYIDRRARRMWVLDNDSMPEIPRPERDVLVALLRHAAERLEEST